MIKLSHEWIFFDIGQRNLKKDCAIDNVKTCSIAFVGIVNKGEGIDMSGLLGSKKWVKFGIWC